MYIQSTSEIDEIAKKRIRAMVRKAGNQSKVARKLGINRGLISYQLKGGHSPTLIEALGLPSATKQVPVCSECGKIHDMIATCHDRLSDRPRIRKAADLKSVDQQVALEEYARHMGYPRWSEYCQAIANDWLRNKDLRNVR
jgi:4-hydroxy-3-methylbut-2-en-1-yl diphosphate synthase IspG/GcpE